MTVMKLCAYQQYYYHYYIYIMENDFSLFCTDMSMQTLYLQHFILSHEYIFFLSFSNLLST